MTSLHICPFRDVAKPSYDRLVREQREQITAKKGEGDLQALLNGNDTRMIN